jgi:uncharacterized caspase-like protein
MGRLVFLALMFTVLLLLRADAQSPRRVALVIGNGTYEEAGTLANPVNDALDMAAKLRGIGFEVIEGHDLGKRALERKIGEFADALTGSAVGLFFYAGHGLQVGARNYIVPVDAKLDVPVKLQLEAVPMDEILDIMEQQTKTSLVFLDACRNNPFGRRLKSSSRSVEALPGLAQFDTSRGSFIAFSTEPWKVAQDGSGRNSPFTTALLQHIAVPGQSINDLMIAVRNDVVAATNGAQRPWEQGSLLERFEFVPDGTAMAAVPPSTEPVQPAAAPEVQVATAERSVDEATEVIESMLRDDYLAPNVSSMRETVQRLYADPATVFGTPLAMEALIKVKTDWFSQFSSWSLMLEPGSLKITPRAESQADAVFFMSYDYVPKNPAMARMTGRAKVHLGLTMIDGRWRIVSETSEALH